MNIKQLRQTILDRAMRGQLVSQDPTDEPASVLLERIRAEKEELIKEKKLKREKRESQPIEEVTFEIPEGWVWCRLGEIGIWGSGVTPSRNKKEYYDGNIPWLKTGDLNDSYIYETSELITDLAVKDCSLKKIPIGSVLIAMYGATIAKLGLLEIEVTINQACCACTPFSGIVNKFLFYYLFSQKQNIKDKAEGGAQPNISKEKLINFPFPLPPLAEQHRIVQKIEQLFALVDIIEVNKKALEELIEQAKSQVLSDAVAGKLTHQDPNDEPAEELLKRIGKTTAPDTPYEKMLPKGWACTEMQVLCQLLDGKKKEGVLYPYLDVVFLRGKTEGSYKENGKYIPKNTHLILVDGENSGEIFTTTIEGYQGSTLKILNISQEVNEQFIFYILRKEQKLFKESKTGSAIPHLNKKIFKELIVFLPPLAEQCRIVKKIETYFAAFDKIKNELI
jgi:type I restriction-modification system